MANIKDFLRELLDGKKLTYDNMNDYIYMDNEGIIRTSNGEKAKLLTSKEYYEYKESIAEKIAALEQGGKMVQIGHHFYFKSPDSTFISCYTLDNVERKVNPYVIFHDILREEQGEEDSNTNDDR